MPPPGNQRTMAALIEKLADLITSPDTLNADIRCARDSAFVSFAAAGMPVDAAALHFGDLSTQEQLRANGRFSELVNSIPGTAGLHGPSGAKIWDVYRRALGSLELPASELSNRETVLLAKAQGFLSFEVPLNDSDTGQTATTLGPTPQYEAYNERLTAYRASVLKYNAARTLSHRAPAAQDLAKAYHDWGSAGYRDYVDQANDIIASIVAKAPRGVYDTFRNTFEGSLRHVPGTGRTFYPTFIYPRAVLDRAYDHYWATFAFSEKDLYAPAAGRKNAGAIPERFAGITASDGSEATTHQIDARGMSIRFEILVVPLVRAWCTRSILASRGWRFPAGSARTASNGVTQPRESPPLLPASIVLVRNLELSLTASKSNECVLKTISDVARASYGPFALKADASSSLGASRHAPNVTSSGLTVSGAQIVAVVCDVLPKSPGRGHSLASQAPAGPPDLGSPLVAMRTERFGSAP